MEDVGHGEDADPDDAVGQRHRRRPSHSQLDQSKALEEIEKKESISQVETKATCWVSKISDFRVRASKF